MNARRTTTTCNEQCARTLLRAGYRLITRVQLVMPFAGDEEVFEVNPKTKAIRATLFTSCPQSVHNVIDSRIVERINAFHEKMGVVHSNNTVDSSTSRGGPLETPCP